ncbi:MAG: transcriptional repressor [Ruminococcaceae bacterium]|nr:transcriptional repressor [Oscillospiraceae bacterium]
MVPKRAAVLQVLQDSEGHLQADEIFQRVKAYYPHMVLATVYNNLHALSEEGYIRHVKTAAGADFYDKTTTPHEHALCTVCGKLIDADLGRLGDVGELLRKNASVPILSYDLILHTVCQDCANGNKQS